MRNPGFWLVGVLLDWHSHNDVVGKKRLTSFLLYNETRISNFRPRGLKTVRTNQKIYAQPISKPEDLEPDEL